MAGLTFGEVESRIEKYATANKDFLGKIDFVVGMSRGGLVPAALLCARIDKPLIAAYIDRQDGIFFDRAGWISAKNILIVDDVVRSGKTMWLLQNRLAQIAKPARISSFALFSVVPLRDKNYPASVAAESVDEDVIFPWDFNYKVQK